MNEQLTQLEKQVKHMKVALIGLAIGCIAYVSMGAAGDVPEKISAKRFVVVDDDGETRAILGWEGDYAGVVFQSVKDHVSSQIGIGADGRPFVKLVSGSKRAVVIHSGVFGEGVDVPEKEPAIMLTNEPEISVLIASTDFLKKPKPR